MTPSLNSAPQLSSGAARRRVRLQQMAGDVATIRASLESSRVFLQRLLEAEGHRRLRPDESLHLRQLRWENKRLHLELAVLGSEFEQLRTSPG